MSCVEEGLLPHDASTSVKLGLKFGVKFGLMLDW